jgi:hypothetical protein
MAKISSAPLPLTIGQRLLPAFKQYQKLIRLYTAARDDLFDVYADLNEETNKREIRESTKSEYEHKYTELMQTDIEWEYDRVDAAEFGGHLQLSLLELSIVDWFFS